MLKPTLNQSAHHELQFSTTPRIPLAEPSYIAMIAIFEYQSAWDGGPVIDFILASDRKKNPDLSRQLPEKSTYSLAQFLLDPTQAMNIITGKDLDNPEYIYIDENATARVIEWARQLVTANMGKFTVKFEKTKPSFPF